MEPNPSMPVTDMGSSFGFWGTIILHRVLNLGKREIETKPVGTLSTSPIWHKLHRNGNFSRFFTKPSSSGNKFLKLLPSSYLAVVGTNPPPALLTVCSSLGIQLDDIPFLGNIRSIFWSPGVEGFYPIRSLIIPNPRGGLLSMTELFRFLSRN